MYLSAKCVISELPINPEPSKPQAQRPMCGSMGLDELPRPQASVSSAFQMQTCVMPVVVTMANDRGFFFFVFCFVL